MGCTNSKEDFAPSSKQIYSELRKNSKQSRLPALLPGYDDRMGCTNSKGDSVTNSNTIYSELREDRKQFRLLTVLPGRDEAAVQCTIEDCRLGTTEYETVSYVWGDPNMRESVLVNNCAISVPESCAVLLRRVRLLDKPRVVWIDAICINQEDPQERGKQVALMGQIYTRAAQNLIYWCGEHELLQSAIWSILGLHKEAVGRNSIRDLLDTAGGFRYFNDVVPESPYDPDVLEWFFSTDWLRRVWTFQEAVLANSNLCLVGPFSIDLLTVLEVATWLYTGGFFTSRVAWPAVELYQGIALERDHLGPLGYLDILRRRKCRLPEDHVYGIIGLFPQLRIVPQYGKHHFKVYQELAISIVSSCQHLMILDTVDHDQTSAGDRKRHLPSWVPDWSRGWDASDNDGVAERLRSGFTADNMRARNAWTRVSRNEPASLHCHGLMLGAVTSVIPTNRSGWDEFEQHELVEGFETTLQAGDKTKTELAIALTLCAATNHLSQPFGPEVVECYRAWRERAASGAEMPLPEHVNASHSRQTDLASRYAPPLLWACSNRKGLVIAQKLIGLGPSFTKQGDIAVILYGYHMPVILRPDGGHFLFLGEAYVHDNMHGEAVLRHDSSGEDDTVFEIH